MDRLITQHKRSGRVLGLNSRGVAFLFQAYLITFWFIVLVGAMLMRSSAELEQARFGVEQQQAFWMAETGTDELTYRLKVNPPELSANECTAPLLRLTTGAETAPNFLGTSSYVGYIAQVCLRPTGEYQITSVSRGGTRAAEVVTAIANVPNHNLQFNHAFLATGSITTRQSAIASVSGTTESMPAAYYADTNTFVPVSTVVHANANLATLGAGSPTPPPCEATGGGGGDGTDTR